MCRRLIRFQSMLSLLFDEPCDMRRLRTAPMIYSSTFPPALLSSREFNVIGKSIKAH
jgi:hypothetical protein